MDTMDTMDGDVQRLATQRVWSEDEGQCIVAAEWRVACGVRAPHRHRGAPALLSDHDDGRARSRARMRTVGFHPGRVLPERGDAGDAAPMEIRMIRVRGVAPEAICAVPAALKQYG